MDIASINIIAIHSTALKFSEVVANNFSINFTEIKNNACAKINTVKRANPDSVTISFIDIEFTDETKLSVIIDHNKRNSGCKQFFYYTAFSVH